MQLFLVADQSQSNWGKDAIVTVNLHAASVSNKPSVQKFRGLANNGSHLATAVHVHGAPVFLPREPAAGGAAL